MVRNVARDVWQICFLPPNAINAYLAGNVLFDAGTRWDVKRFMRVLAGVDLSMLALTHVHPDHQGAAKAICDQFRCPLACHEADRPAMEGTVPMGPPSRAIRWSSNLLAGPRRAVDRVLREGDEVGGFQVVHAPGHTMGHVIYFRESDRVAIAGDVIANMHFITTRPGLREPPSFFSMDRALNRKSMRRLLELEPRTVLFGHGPPLRDIGKLRKFVNSPGA